MMAKLIGIMHSANFSLMLCAWFLMFLSNTSQTTDTTPLTSVKLNTTVATIDLSNSSLTSIPPDLFKNQTNLQQVDLSNNQISYLNGSIFTALVNLETLILSNNAIKIITVNVFRNLTNLMFLDLSQNSIRDLPDNLFVDNTDLEVLRLDGNNISEVRRDTFVGLRSLKLLFLNTSGLSRIHSSSFTPLVELEELYLQDNDIAFQEDYTGVTGNIFRNLRNLRLLDLSKNSITFLPDNMFEDLIQLEVLHLDSNKFSTVSRDIFVGLRSLKLLFLNASGLSSIDILSFTRLLELEELYLQENDIDFYKITANIFRDLQNLRLLDLAKNSITFLPENIFVDLINLEVLRLDGNNISPIRIDTSTFADLRSLKRLFLNTCGLSSTDLYSFTPLLLELEELYLQGNDIDFQGLFPQHVQLTSDYPDIFNNLQNLRLLDLSKNSITFLPDYIFDHLRKLEVLRLDGNNFPTITDSTFYVLRSLQKLYLNDTGLEIIHPYGFDFGGWELKELYLQGNNITYLPWEGLQELHLTVLDLGNKNESEYYSCNKLPNCTFNNSYIYENIAPKFSCCNYTMSCRIDPSIGLCLNWWGPTSRPDPEYLTSVYISLMTFAGLIVVFIIVLYCKRKYLQVWLYMKCGWRFDPKDDDDDDKTYDAFISYSSRDELIVIRELAPGLEERGFKLCLHYRDFPVGACIATTIIETVEASRRTVILLSQNFVDSEWCALEFKAAHRQVLEDRRNRIVVIVLDDLELQNMDKDLKFYLKTNTYLKWGDPWFWSKLCYALPRVGRGAPESHDLMNLMSEEV